MSNAEIEDWYLARRGKRYGPGSLSYVRASSGNDDPEPDDMLWRPGMTEWIWAEQAASHPVAAVTPSTRKPPPIPRLPRSAASLAEEKQSTEERDVKLKAHSEKRIGGWLILLGFVLLASGLRNLLTLTQDVGLLSGALSESERKYVFISVIWSGSIALLWFYLLIPFFGRRTYFPNAFSAVVGLTILSAIASPFVAQAMIQSPITAEDSTNMLRAIVFGALWLTYVLVSRRVNYTFIH